MSKYTKFKKKTSVIKILIAILIALISIAYCTPVNALNSSGLVIVPREDYVVNPGSSSTNELLVTNLNNNSRLNLTLKYIDFTYANETGTPKLILNQDTPQTPWSLEPYLSFPSTISIPPSQSVEVKISISIPKNINPGSYYGGIEYLANNGQSSGISLSSSGTTLLFVNVPGKVYENMSLIHAGAFQTDNSISGGKYIGIATDPPSEIAYTIKNAGNVIETPEGSINLQETLGGHNIQITNANPDSSIALIGQTRIFTACIKTVNEQVSLNKITVPAKVCQKNPDLFPGKYNITVDVFYGQNGGQNYEVYGIGHFWYLPWWSILLAVMALLLIIYIIVRLHFLLKKAINMNEENNESEEQKTE